MKWILIVKRHHTLIFGNLFSVTFLGLTENCAFFFLTNIKISWIFIHWKNSFYQVSSLCSVVADGPFCFQKPESISHRHSKKYILFSSDYRYQPQRWTDLRRAHCRLNEQRWVDDGDVLQIKCETLSYYLKNCTPLSMELGNSFEFV